MRLYATTLVAALCFCYLWGEKHPVFVAAQCLGMTGLLHGWVLPSAIIVFAKAIRHRGVICGFTLCVGLFPYGLIFCFCALLADYLGQYYQQALTGQFSWGSFIAATLVCW